MKRNLSLVLLFLMFLTGLYPVLRHDLFHFAWRQGREALARGDDERGMRALAWAERMRGGDLFLAYDAGVALYRRGAYAQALDRFSAAGAAGDPGLKEAALYNGGNAAVKEAQRKEGDASESAALLRQAETSYRQALELNPRAADAKRNLELVRVRLQALDAGRDGAPGRESRGGSVTQQTSVERQGRERGQEEGEKSGGNKAGEESDQAARHGGRAAEMSREDAERLLAEERGRETLAPQLLDAGGKGRHAPAGKEW
uniref:Tetratricopeptide repeat protein n=1 Tax=Geobacter sp. (strain M21) TaxID=443144 RepID=C6DZT6_GEOSM